MSPEAPASARSPVLARRTALVSLGAGALALPAVAGCSSTPAATPTERRTVRSRDVDPDVALAAQALAGLDVAASRLADVARSGRALRRRVAPIRRLVDAHRAQLREAVPAEQRSSPSPSPTASSGSGGTTSTRGAEAVRAELRRLPALLTEQAVRAESGAFARLLAQMAAGYAQERFVFEGRPL